MTTTKMTAQEIRNFLTEQGFTDFTKNNWYAFGGCESEKPMIMMKDGYDIIWDDTDDSRNTVTVMFDYWVDDESYAISGEWIMIPVEKIPDFKAFCEWVDKELAYAKAICRGKIEIADRSLAAGFELAGYGESQNYLY